MSKVHQSGIYNLLHIFFYSKKEEKDGCCFLWQGFYGSVDVVNFPIFKEKEVKQVALGGDHCLFLTKDGGVYACGQNNYGQLGIGNLETKETHDPVLVESLTGSFSVHLYAEFLDHKFLYMFLFSFCKKT